MMAVLVCFILVCYSFNARKKDRSILYDVQLHSLLPKINTLRPRFLCRLIASALLKR
ncbi:MAG: hypothetical protein ACI9SB_000789 [Candidatus Azotimanducaceae bacterium]|jgi:hypothetical protein